MADSDDDLLAAYAAFMAEHPPVEGVDPEILGPDGNLLVGRYDHCGRWTVKPVRGGVPDAPVVKHLGFGCVRGAPCACPPVDVEAFQAATVGLKMRGSSVPAPTASKADMREIKVGPGVKLEKPLRPPKYPNGHGPLFGPPVPHLPMADQAPVQTSTGQGVDPHLTCKQKARAAATALARTEHALKLAKAKLDQYDITIRRQAAAIQKLTKENAELTQAERATRKAIKRITKAT